MQRLISCLAVACLLASSNLDLAVLQAVAWTGMLVNYSQDRTLSEAATMTFDGEHPCGLCCAIKKAQAKPVHELSASPLRDGPTLFLENTLHATFSMRSFALSGMTSKPAPTPLQDPPVPPPRAAAWAA